MTDTPKKKRKFKIQTPGQSREYEKLSAERMFQAYEDAPANSTGPAIANWDPPLGKPAKVMYKKRRKLNMDTLNAVDTRVDGRTKSYREAVRRIKERQERLRERQVKSKLTQFGITENPFGKPVDEIHTPKDRASTDAAISAWKKAGGKVEKIKPGQPKGMPKRRKELNKSLKREEVEMNKKYLKTREGSIEDAVLSAVRMETPENPNSYRPTLTLPKNKYLATKEGSIEQAVERALTEAGATKKQVRMAKGIANDPRHKGGDMTGAWKKAEKIKKGLGDHPKVAAALRRANEEEEIDEAPYAIGTWTTQGRTDSEVKSDVGAKRFKSLQLRRKTQQAGRDRRKAETGYTRHGGSRAKKEEIEVQELNQKEMPTKKIAKKLKPKSLYPPNKPIHKITGDQVEDVSKEDIENMIRFGKDFVVGEKKEVNVPDTRRTVDAIRAYDRSKDASRDADYDTAHGKAKKGDIEKKYAKKERGEIDKDDPRWKHRDYHTGIHGEEVEIDEKMDPSQEREMLKKNVNNPAQSQKAKELMKKRIAHLSKKEEYEIDELSKKTMGSYIKKASSDAETRMGNLERARGQAAERGQLGDVDAQIRAHKPTRARLKSRPAGIARAADKLSKEETEMSPLIRATIDKIHSMREDKLSYKERQGLPKGDFALPGKGSGPEGKQGGSYPIPDESHARNALARVSQHGSPAEKAKVKAAVEKKFPGIKVSEAKDREIGTDEYVNYTKEITPGEEPDTAVKSVDAKKASIESKKASDAHERQVRKIDDEFVIHLESLEGDALEAALDGLSPNELLEILGTGLVKKAAGAVKKRFSVAGRTAAAQKKGEKMTAKAGLIKQKTSNIAAKAKLKAAKADHKAAKQAAKPPKPAGKVKMVPGKGITSA